MTTPRENTNLLQQIVDLTIDANASLGNAMRKAKILAQRLDNEQFKRWVDHELSGYRSKDELPNYRIIRSEPLGDFHGMWGSGYRNMKIHLTAFPESFHEYLSMVYLMEGVGFYEREVALLPRDVPLREDLRQDLVVAYRDQIVDGYTLVQAWKPVDVGVFANLTEQVRNRLLSFCLEIESLDPDAGERRPPDQKIEPQTISSVFNTYIFGESSNVAVGSTDIIQSRNIIHTGNIESLVDHLRAQGISEEDLVELESAIRDDPKPDEPERFGPLVSDWAGKMVAKAMSGAWTVSTNTAGGILAQAINQYYGIG